MSEDVKNILYTAIRKGNIEIIRNLIASTKDFAHFINDVCTHNILESAVLTKRIDIVQLLLENGAKVDNRREEHPFSALLAAVHIGNEKMVNMLLDKNADVDAKDTYGQSPLHIAAKLGHLRITELLLDHGANINSLSNSDDDRQETPLYLAVEKNRLEIVELLLSKGANINAGGLKSEKPVYVATKLGYVEIVHVLLNLGAEVNAIYKSMGIMNIENFTLLHAAAKYNQAEVAKLLINNGANVNAVDGNQRTPIFYAVQSNGVSVTKILLNNGATTKNSLLNTAVMEGHREIVEILLQQNIDIHDQDDQHRTTLHHAGIVNDGRWKHTSLDEAAKERYKSDKAEIAKLLLSRGASVNLKDRHGVAVLYSAARNNNIKLVQILLEYKANVNIEERDYRTPLHAATYCGNEDIVKMLLNRGAHVNAVTEDGLTALYIASKEGSKKLVELFLKHGAKVDCTLKRKHDFASPRRMKNPLNIAVEKGHYEIVELLLKFGLPIDFGNPTPLQTAAYNGKVDILHLLMEYGADINANIQSFGSPVQAANFVLPHLRYCGEDRREGCKKIANILEQRIVKMTAASMHVDEAHIEEDDFRDNYKNLENDCKQEIEVMKNEKIGNSNVLFYDVLTKDIKQVTMYARNKSIVKALESKQLDEKFPQYSQLIKEHFKRGQRRNSLMNLSSKLIINSVASELPVIVTDAILKYLSNEELIFFINALRHDNF